MIFVTVGMHTQPFDRLVRAADGLAALVDERVIIQRGVTSYVPRCAQHVDYADGEKMGRWLSEARMVISHAGAGSILGVLRAGKPNRKVAARAQEGSRSWISRHRLGTYRHSRGTPPATNLRPRTHRFHLRLSPS